MKTDAMQFFTGGNDAAPRRMDSTRGRGTSGASAEFAAAEGARREQDKPFRKVMEEVAADNETAQRITGETVEKRTVTGSDRNSEVSSSREKEENSRNTDSPPIDSSMVSTDEPVVKDTDLQPDDDNGEEKPVELIDAQTAEQAESIVRDALAEISGALGISIFQDLENLSLREIGSETKSQFAEIVFVLKKLVQGLELGKVTGMSVETPKATLDGDAIDKIADVLRTGGFKIEMACNILGIAGEVQEQVAVKLEQTAGAGIVQAVDPKTLAMAARHTEQLFGGLFTDAKPADDLASLIEKVKKLIGDNGDGQPFAAIETEDGGTKAKTDTQQFETRVYRAVLKIDKVDQSAVENRTAAGTVESAEQPKIVPGGIAIAQPLAEAAKNDGSGGVVSPLDIKPVSAQPVQAGADQRIAGALVKMTDDAVMEQITGKMHAVIRSGLTEMRIQLRPESLGDVTMRIRMEGDVVQAKIEVQNQQVKEIMERNLPALRDSLAQQNLTTGSIEIQVGNGLGRHSGGAQQSPWNQDETAQGGMGREEKERENATTGNNEQQGAETGRRFGGNSVEYFA